MARVPLGARPLRLHPLVSGGTLVALGLLLFFDRDWWLQVLLNRALDALGLGGQL